MTVRRILFGMMITLFTDAAIASSHTGSIEKIKMTADSLTFECRMPSEGGDHVHRIEVNRQTQTLRFRLHNGVEIGGPAVATRVPSKAETYYYMTNGYYPFRYRFSITVMDNGTSASFQMVEGARVINCVP